MTVFPSATGGEPALFGREGELISVRISIEPRLLEDLLEALASLHFPVNPQLYHKLAQVTVEFPAYSERIDEVRGILLQHGFDTKSLELSRGLAAIAGI